MHHVEQMYEGYRISAGDPVLFRPYIVLVENPDALCVM